MLILDDKSLQFDCVCIAEVMSLFMMRMVCFPRFSMERKVFLGAFGLALALLFLVAILLRTSLLLGLLAALLLALFLFLVLFLAILFILLLF